MIRRALAGVLGLLMWLGPSSAIAQQDPPPATAPASDPRLLEELQQLQHKLEQVRDLTTKFTQEKHTPLLRKPLVSTGEIRILGKLMRWDTHKPAPSVMLISEEGIRLYYPKQKLLEIYRLDQQLARLAASPVPRIDVMQEHFAFSRIPASEQGEAVDGRYLPVRLTPRQQTLAQHIDEVRLLIDRETAYLRQMEMVDTDGDRTIIRFEDVKLNTGLTQQELTLEPPPGTRISHPLSGDESR